MRGFKHIVSLWLVLFSTSIIAQNANRKFERVVENAQHIEVATSDGSYIFKPYSNEIMETSFVPTGEAFSLKSDAVVMKPTGVHFEVKKKGKKIEIQTPGITVQITKNPFQITYYYKGEFLVSERNGYEKTEEHEVLDFNLTSSEIIYGGGARVLGMNRRGYRLQLYNRAHYGYETHSELMNFTLPIVYSSNKYMLHFDNAAIGYLDFDSKKDNSLRYETISGRKTYQVVAADSYEDMVVEYTKLTGRQPMIPRWALGNFSSRFGYHTQEETVATIDKFLEEGIPVDAVILDLYWFGKEVHGTMGNLDFHKPTFPDPEKMISDLNDRGVKTILITEPFILKTSSKWDETSKKGLLGTNAQGEPLTYDFFFGHTALIDIYKPEAEQWFWNVYKKFTDLGVGGWWGDLGEPEVHPTEMIHARGTADEVHNIYGHYWAKLIYDGYKRDFPEQRPFILMRAGYAGSQHYGMVPWTGDVNRTWGGLKPQVEISLQMGMQGLAYMHSDLGGFAGANLDDELYTRWLQYGVFQPIYRPHAQEEVPSEPVFREEKTKARAKESIKLRYSLMPYHYTMVFENNQHGTPLMRPIFFEDTSKSELLEYKASYFWGPDFLVSPITEPGVKEHEVYFPANNNWFDFYTDEKIGGGQYKKVVLNMESIPTYVRGGAIIPMVKPVQTSQLYSLNNVDLHYYFDASVKKSTAKMYSDNGITPEAFEKGMHEITGFNSKVTEEGITFEIGTELGENYSFEKKNFNLKIHNMAQAPSSITGFNYQYHKEAKILEINVPYLTKSTKSIHIKF